MASTAKSVGRKMGKENIPAKSTHLDEFDDLMDDEEVESRKPTSLGKSTSAKPLKGSKARQETLDNVANSGSSADGRRVAELERHLASMTAERDRCKALNDDLAKQFEQLSKLRGTDVESVFEKYKERADMRAKAQDDIIAKQTAALDKAQKKIIDLEARLEKAAALPAAGGPFDTAAKSKVDVKEVKALREELASAKTTIDAKNRKVAELQKQVEDEVKFSRQLQAQAKNATSGAAPTTIGGSSEESAKDAASLRLYEDITDLNIVNVTITENPRRGKEIVFNCIQTHGGKSHNFKLKSHNVLDQAKAKAKDANPWIKTVQYTPGNLENETQEFRDELGPFVNEFAVPRDQLISLFDNLKSNMAGDD